jgi:hypothetical protein
MKPKIENTPGIIWRPYKDDRWEARWLARTDIVKRGFRPKSIRVWLGSLDDMPVGYIQDRANSLQAEMLVWGRGGIAPMGAYDGTVRALAEAYQTDPDSPFHKTRYVSRLHYMKLLGKLIEGHGDELIADIKPRFVLRWHEAWCEPNPGNPPKVAMGHAMVGMLRTILTFGVTLLEDDDCAKLSAGLSKMKFKMAKPRSVHMTAEQATAIRKAAHANGYPSMALAQAIQFDCMLRQKDVIGEWVPINEPGISDTIDGQHKWLRGLRWEEIDDALVLRHITSKRDKPIVLPLSEAPMVMEELAIAGRKAIGPVVICEGTGRPWQALWFRKVWRKLANECGIPNDIRNMDSRSGGITEAAEAGAPMEHIRKAATHSQIAQTEKYSRGDEAQAANVLRIRAKHRRETE